MILELTIAAFSGGTLTFAFSKFFMTKKEEKDYALELLKVINNDREIMQEKMNVMQTSMNKLQSEYNELLKEHNGLQVKYNQLKTEFNKLKNQTA